MTTEPQNEAPKQPKAPPPAIKAGGKVRGLIPQTIEEAARLAEGYFRSGMTPESYQVKRKYRDEKGNEVEDIDPQGTMARLLIGILKGMEVGLPPIAAISTIYIVNGRPTIYGDGALALVIDSDVYEWHKEEIIGDVKKPEWTARCTIKRAGIEEPIVRTFTWQNAIDANLTGKFGPWKQYPARQMQMRARAFALRDGFADVLMGLGITEEIADIQQDRPEPPKAEVQQDQFTMKALESKPAETVDFSTLKAAKPEPVPVATPAPAEPPQEAAAESRGQISTNPEDRKDPAVKEAMENLMETAKEPAPDQSGFTVEKTPLEQAIDKKQADQERAIKAAKENAFPGCQTCQGKGTTEWEDVDQTTGEVQSGIGPCPECSPPPKEAKPKKDDGPQFDLGDLLSAG